MRERRPQPAEHQRHAHRHAQLLQARRQPDRLDAVRDEFRVARDGREAKSVSGAGQRAQQLLDVRLVARSVASEHIRIDNHERIAHPAASR